MKKIILSAALLMAVGFSAKAQEDVKLGIKAGVNFANFGGDVEDADSRTGFHAGVVAEFKLSENFSIQPELLYSQMGSKFEASGSFAGVAYSLEQTSKFDYLSLPILAKYYIIEGLSIEAGPQVGYLLSAKNEVKGSGSDELLTSGDVKDGSKSVDFGLAGGLAYDLPMGVFFQARYYAGISNVNDGDGDLDVKNSALQLSVGYKF
ncbi:hypothetical protein Q765_18100 [Flavobacterium rivuli WB 3.3-2 = DSM 21788]|uniref:Outer membrane protein beta-barrel domain-containing protein n=1 Tax=Flavobacterium rivuli WB 3.3-2 = DSM 21788 TaxID=1121895 RepID=A0A0A2M9T8_9FLAO|nr:porin family protein [Flavobacterium rivuli]KGO85055.1 hypothetical protein Q765_18100 [Flavobacterium rivuli WB 3.3-2 = DSM 21788]